MKRNRAVFTICQNEPVFLPVWLRYYGRHFARADTFVLDHDSADGSVAKAWQEFRPNVVQVHRDESFDHTWLRDTVAAFHRFLLQSYTNVLFVEVDEIVVADPLHYPQGLGQYVETNAKPVVRCLGYNLHHQPAEPQLDWARPILPQRSVMWMSGLYSKPLLTRVPVAWSTGFHSLEDTPEPVPLDKNLLLVHLHRADYLYCRRRHEETAKRNWSKKDVEHGLGIQNRIFEPVQFDKWFKTAQLGEQRCNIPDHIKETF